jgi:hypothetical protein
MGRKAFVNDLRDAALPGRFSQISSVMSGDDDGTIKFLFQTSAFSVEEIAVDAMVSGMFSPKAHLILSSCNLTKCKLNTQSDFD